MPQYITHKDGAFNIYTTIADGFYFEPALTVEELETYIKQDQGQKGLATLPERLERARKQGSSSMLNHSLEDLCSANADGLSYDECIKRFMTLPPYQKIATKEKEELNESVVTLKEALRICVAQLKEITDNENVYDDARGKKISFNQLNKMIL